MVVKLRYVDLFSGVGGIALALRDLIQPVTYCEIDPDARAVLVRNMGRGLLPSAPIAGDVRELRGASLGRVDLIAGGWPCQDFSLIGRRQGLAGERSSLVYEVLRLVEETGRPPLVFLENVPAALNMALPRVARRFAAMGYQVRWCVMPATAVGAAHLRKRLFLLAVHGQHARDLARGASTARLGLVGGASPFCAAGGCDVRRANGKVLVPLSTAPEPPRMLRPAQAALDAGGRTRRAVMLGNAVVPACVRAAFIVLASGFKAHAAQLMAGRRIAGWLQLTARGTVVLARLDPLPRWGATDGRTWHAGPEPVDLYTAHHPNLELVLTPRAFRRMPSSPTPSPSPKRLRSPLALKLWATPRASATTASLVLTQRTADDLASQLRFEKSTTLRDGQPDPRFIEWLMGYPPDWTDGGVRH